MKMVFRALTHSCPVEPADFATRCGESGLDPQTAAPEPTHGLGLPHGSGARASGSATAGGASRQTAQVNNAKADARTNNVRSTSVNNVNVERNVNVEHGCCGGWDNDYHPVATAAAVGTAVAVTSAIVGSMVRSVPPGSVPVNYDGMVYQQCGATWYQPQGSQYVVVNPPY